MQLLTQFSHNIGRLFADKIFKIIFWNETSCISMHISLRFVLKGPSDNQSTLIQKMAWRWLDQKQLSEQNYAT